MGAYNEYDNVQNNAQKQEPGKEKLELIKGQEEVGHAPKGSGVSDPGQAQGSAPGVCHNCSQNMENEALNPAGQAGGNVVQVTTTQAVVVPPPKAGVSVRCMTIIKVLVVLSLVVIVVGGIMLGVGEQEDIEDIEDPEEVLFLVGAVLVGLGIAAFVVMMIVGCVLRSKNKSTNVSQPQSDLHLFQNRAPNAHYIPRSVKDTDDIHATQVRYVSGPIPGQTQPLPTQQHNPMYRPNSQNPGMTSHGAVPGNQYLDLSVENGGQLPSHANQAIQQSAPAQGGYYSRPMVLSIISEREEEPPVYEELDSSTVSASASRPEQHLQHQKPAMPSAPPAYDAIDEV